jgi:hypothetical protein
MRYRAPRIWRSSGWSSSRSCRCDALREQESLLPTNVTELVPVTYEVTPWKALRGVPGAARWSTKETASSRGDSSGNRNDKSFRARTSQRAISLACGA